MRDLPVQVTETNEQTAGGDRAAYWHGPMSEAARRQVTRRTVCRSRPPDNSRHKMCVDRVQRTTHATRCALIASNAHLTPRVVRWSRPMHISRHELYAGRVQRTTCAATGRCPAISRFSYALKAEKSLVRLSLASPKSMTHFGL